MTHVLCTRCNSRHISLCFSTMENHQRAVHQPFLRRETSDPKVVCVRVSQSATRVTMDLSTACALPLMESRTPLGMWHIRASPFH